MYARQLPDTVQNVSTRRKIAIYTDGSHRDNSTGAAFTVAIDGNVIKEHRIGMRDSTSYDAKVAAITASLELEWVSTYVTALDEVISPPDVAICAGNKATLASTIGRTPKTNRELYYKCRLSMKSKLTTVSISSSYGHQDT